MRQGIEMKRKTNLAEATLTVMFHNRTPSLGFFRVHGNVEQTLPPPLTVTADAVSNASAKSWPLTLVTQTPSPVRRRGRSLAHTEYLLRTGRWISPLCPSVG
jgi:hypothetical protein